MNMKVDWATVAVQTLQQLLAGQEIGFTMDEVDSLLSRYAGKALDFPYSLREKRSGNHQHPRWGFHTEEEVLCYILHFNFSSSIILNWWGLKENGRDLGLGGRSMLTRILKWQMTTMCLVT